MLERRIGICVMAFDPPLLPLKRDENWIVIAFKMGGIEGRSLFGMRREGAID
jgi:hypothetical protein